MSLDQNKTYLQWNGTTFPNSSEAQFRAPAGSSIDWGDGTIETFNTASTTVNTHTYTDGKTNHTITLSGLTSIGGWAFYECSGLTSVTIGNGVENIDTYAFYGCNSLMSATIGNVVTSIGNNAFYNCIGLTSVTIPDSVVSIGNYTFGGCSGLTRVTIGNGVTSIGDQAFQNCTKLPSITIPDSVTGIGNYAFYNCTALKIIILFPETPPNINSSNVFPATISSIYVQHSSKEAYKTAQYWSSFADKIVSDNIYLSFVRFNQKNKEYINGKVDELSIKVAPILSDYVDDTLLGG